MSKAIVAALAAVFICATSASAIDKCKVKANKKTGLIEVSATGVGGPLLWGEESGSETSSFDNAGTCISSGKAKKCHLADPLTIAARTPPADCTLYFDDGVAACSAWVPGCVPGTRAVEATKLSGGGTFLRNSITTLHSVISLSATGIDTSASALGTVQAPAGHVRLTSMWQPGSTAQYFSDFDVDCIVLESYDAETGDYELVLSGVKNAPSRVTFDGQPTSDPGIVSDTFSLTGDPIVGRLKRVDGVVSRSDWTSGYETCVGRGWGSLFLDSGAPIYSGGTNTIAEFYACEALIGSDPTTEIPSCASFAPGGPNDGALPTDRSLGGDITFSR